MTKNVIGLYKGVVCLKDAGQSNLAMAMSVQAQLMHYGYMLNEQAFSQLKSADAADIKDFFDEVINFLKEMTGGKREFKSLYGNFPNDVMSMSESELWFKQISHYWGKKSFPKKGGLKSEAFEQVSYRELKAVNDEEFLNIYKTLAESGQSLVPMDQRILSWFGNSEYKDRLPTVTINFKENLAILLKVIPSLKVKTVVDVLRAAVVLSGGDPSLPAVPKKPTRGRNIQDRIKEREKFKFKLSQPEKERILAMFESSNLDKRDMNQGSRYGRFIRLAEVLQVQRYQKEFPKTSEAFYHLRNQKRKGKPNGEPKIRTWYSDVQKAFKTDFLTGITKLSERPGEFLRKLDYLIRKYPKNIDSTLLILTRIGEKSSNKVLFEVFTHFENRRNPVTSRSVFIKGAKSRRQLPNLPAIPSEAVEAVQDTILNIFKSKLSLLPAMGNVYIDPELKKIPLPTNMRSMSDSLVPTIRGQRVPFGEGKKVIRPFIHWYDQRGDEDLDLHGFLIGPKISTQFGFNGLRSGGKLGCFSGDVIRRRGACAEYVDIVVDEALKEGYEYFIMVVHNFTNRPLDTLKDCVAGVMERENPESNLSWVPSTVQNCMKLKSSAAYALVAAFDLKSREYIYLDMDWSSFSTVSNSSSGGLMKAIELYIAEPKISIYDLLDWHVIARGGKKTAPEAAETHFLFKDFSTDYTKVLPLMGC